MKGLFKKLSDDLPLVLGSLSDLVRPLKTLEPTPRRHLSLFMMKGYELHPDDDRRPRKAIAKATRDGQVVALKALDSGGDELKILRYLQSLGPDRNHVIKLLDTIPFDDGEYSDSVCDIIVMPRLSSSLLSCHGYRAWTISWISAPIWWSRCGLSS